MIDPPPAPPSTYYRTLAGALVLAVVALNYFLATRDRGFLDAEQAQGLIAVGIGLVGLGLGAKLEAVKKLIAGLTQDVASVPGVTAAVVKADVKEAVEEVVTGESRSPLPPRAGPPDPRWGGG